MVYLVAAAGGLLPNLLIQRYLDLLLLVHQIPRTYLHRLLLLSSASPLIFLFFLLLSLPPTFPLLSSSLLFSLRIVSSHPLVFPLSGILSTFQLLISSFDFQPILLIQPPQNNSRRLSSYNRPNHTTLSPLFFGDDHDQTLTHAQKELPYQLPCVHGALSD